VLAEAAPALRELGREGKGDALLQVRLRSRRASGPAGIDVDLLVPMNAIEAWALATSVRGRTAGQRVDVASLEALIVLKLRAYLDDPASRAGLKHRVDAMSLVQTAGPDLALLRRFLAESPELLDALEAIVMTPAPRPRGS
jgi:hypothetical protein